jgi:hypothetical protein
MTLFTAHSSSLDRGISLQAIWQSFTELFTMDFGVLKVNPMQLMTTISTKVSQDCHIQQNSIWKLSQLFSRPAVQRCLDILFLVSLSC